MADKVGQTLYSWGLKLLQNMKFHKLGGFKYFYPKYYWTDQVGIKIPGTGYYVDMDQGIHKGKMKVALNEKRKKLRGFSFSINIANFEAFLLVFKLTKTT